MVAHRLPLTLAGRGAEQEDEAAPHRAQRQALTTLTATEDASVHESNAASNHGSATSLLIKDDAGASRWAFLKFNLTGIAGVTRARPRVHGESSTAAT
ncbi:MAG: hypothetical protein EOO71_03410 [Myxococcaceae bacterium]|nr:MAG: hypothetical protein EOO71_03410 [Myxococcaceae bacterium]